MYSFKMRHGSQRLSSRISDFNAVADQCVTLLVSPSGIYKLQRDTVAQIYCLIESAAAGSP